MASVVAYVRVSTDDQQLGQLAQADAIRAWAERHGLELDSTHVDEGVSGATPVDERPGLSAAIARAAELKCDLVVARRDRLARDVMVAAIAERLVARHGGRVVSSAGESSDDDGPAGQLMRTILDAFAAYERALIRQRTSAAKRVQARDGSYMGGPPPYGYRPAGGKLVPVPAEQATIARARDMRAEGKTLRAVAEGLECEGRLNRDGRRFSPSSISGMLSIDIRQQQC